MGGATPWAETPAAGDTRGRGGAAARSLPGSVPEKPSLGVKHLPGVAQALSVNGNQPGQKWGSVPAEREGARNPGIVGERGGSQGRRLRGFGCLLSSNRCEGYMGLLRTARATFLKLEIISKRN